MHNYKAKVLRGRDEKIIMENKKKTSCLEILQRRALQIWQHGQEPQNPRSGKWKLGFNWIMQEEIELAIKELKRNKYDTYIHYDIYTPMIYK